MTKRMILIAGMPGTGKTSFANYLSREWKIPLICKDKMKEIIWDCVHYDTSNRENAQKYGCLAYELSFHFCEKIMEADGCFLFESNFTDQAKTVLDPLVQKYGYQVITVLFDGDINVIHRRFLERDVTEERHPGLVSHAYFRDIALFSQAAQACRNFRYGDEIIIVDTTDFSTVSYEKITKQIQNKIQAVISEP